MDRVATLQRHLTAAATAVAGGGSREFTREQLRPFNGQDKKQIYIALKGVVFDVTEGKGFYGPGGGYFALAGKDASRALALMDLEPKTVDNSDISDLNAEQKKTLDSWYDRFKSKYPVVGKLVGA